MTSRRRRRAWAGRFRLIVRQEKGVINRSAYLINILHDPAAGPLPSPAAASTASGWNGKLIYSFGAASRPITTWVAISA
jgi:hypothetical protein